MAYSLKKLYDLSLHEIIEEVSFGMCVAHGTLFFGTSLAKWSLKVLDRSEELAFGTWAARVSGQNSPNLDK